MLYLFHCWDPSRAPLFQTGWFVESLMTQTLIIHVIRTRKIPFIRGPCQLASYCHYSRDYVHRHVAALFAGGRHTGLRPSAGAILANPFPHAALLCSPDTARKNVADAQIVALEILGSPPR